MPLPTTAILGVAAPIGVSAFTLAIAWRPWSARATQSRWGTPVSICLGFIAGTIALLGFKGVLPVRSVADYLPHAALIALAASLLVGFTKSGAGRLLVGVLACAGATALVTRIRPTDQLQPVIIVTGAIGLGMLLAWGCLSAASRTSTGARAPIALIIALTCTSVALIQSQTASLAQVYGALAATLGPVMLLAAWRPSLGVMRSGTLATAIIGVAILGAWRLTCFDVSPWSHAEALGALCAPVLSAWAPIRRLRPWVGTIVVSIATLALGLVAIRLAPSGFDFSGLG